ncbi:MAG: hypothetical protein PUD94_09505, partial [Prevotellaceae bacterium]|nr:hypothetical protein [Prevotellaceae bacterium]
FHPKPDWLLCLCRFLVPCHGYSILCPKLGAKVRKIIENKKQIRNKNDENNRNNVISQETSAKIEVFRNTYISVLLFAVYWNLFSLLTFSL